MEEKVGSSTTTYRLKLHYKNLNWLIATKQLYNDVMLFYYQLLLERRELLEYGNQKVMRELELLTIPSRDKQEPKIPLLQEKVPVYFRRAAINSAIGLVRTYHAKLEAWLADSSLEQPKPAKEFNAQPLFYKGMYKEFSQDSILLKLWSGSAWIWVKHTIKGRMLPDNAEILSPTIAIHQKKVMLHVPVKQVVDDIRTVKERVKEQERICSVSLSSSDTLAVCTILESDGRLVDSCFIRGGNELKHRRKRLLGKIARNQRLMGAVVTESKQNKALYEKRNAVTDYYAHLVSRRIVDYCERHNVKIIVFQKVEQGIPLKDKRYLEVRENDFIGRRIKSYVEYKAFSKGIVVTTVRPNYTACKCHVCRSYITRYKEAGSNAAMNFGGKFYVCENGHKGNVCLNTSKNIGMMFIKRFEFAKAV